MTQFNSSKIAPGNKVPGLKGMVLSIKKNQLFIEVSIIQSWFVILAVVLPALYPVEWVKAKDSAESHTVKQQIEKIEEFNEKDEIELDDEDDSASKNYLGENVRLNGAIEFNYEYLDVDDPADKAAGSSSDFFMSTAELALRVFFNEWSKAKVVVEAVDIGKTADEPQVLLDEAILTLQNSQIPMYIIAGKTVMPFGVFEDHLIEGTLAEDIYEIDDWGVTLGFNPDYYGLDISFSIYRDSQVIYNLQDYNTYEIDSEHQKDTFKSAIANVTFEPFEDILTLSVFYDTEPGTEKNNQAIGGAVTVDYLDFTLDAEYITAIQRDKGENEKENKESVGIIGLAFDMLESLQLAARYEFFNDDNPGNQDEVLDYRIIAGFNYSILDKIHYVEDAALSFEYRHSKFEREQESEAADSQNMVQIQLTLEF